MRILAANLKHFYQCQRLWIFYLFFLPMVLLMFFVYRHRPERGFGYYLFLSLLFGVISADLQKAVLTKPFSFCMPRHRAVPRKIILSIGGLVNLLLALLFLRYQWLESPNALLTALAIGFAGMIFFLLGVWAVFLLKGPAVVGYLGMIIMAAAFFGVDEPLSNMVTSFPLQVIMAGMLACGFAWKWLGNESVARKLCGKNILGFTDAWNWERAKKYREIKASEKLSKRASAVTDYLGDFFLTRMKASDPFSGSRYVLGDFYIILSRIFGPWWMTSALSLIGIIILFQYYLSEGMIGNYIFIFPAFSIFGLDLIPHRTMVLPSGRKQKHYGALISGLAVTVLFTVIIAIAAIALNALSGILPAITLKGRSYVFHAIDVREFYFCLFLMPIAFTITTLFLDKALARGVALVVIVVTWMGFGAYAEGPTFISLVGVPGVVSLVAASWISFVVLVGYHCRRRSLVGQGK